jgi:hypothetical protein
MDIKQIKYVFMSRKTLERRVERNAKIIEESKCHDEGFKATKDNLNILKEIVRRTNDPVILQDIKSKLNNLIREYS